MKILAVDPGLKKIGLAVSDPAGMTARPLAVFRCQSLPEVVAKILETVQAEHAERILLGSSHEAGEAQNTLTRFTHRLLAELRAHASVPVVLWDESFSTQSARQVRRIRGDRKKARRKAEDSLAAAVFLEEYLDHHGHPPT